MVDIKKLDNELYNAIYLKQRIGNYKEIWGKIKINSKILREATKVIRDNLMSVISLKD